MPSVSAIPLSLGTVSLARGAGGVRMQNGVVALPAGVGHRRSPSPTSLRSSTTPSTACSRSRARAATSVWPASSPRAHSVTASKAPVEDVSRWATQGEALLYLGDAAAQERAYTRALTVGNQPWQVASMYQPATRAADVMGEQELLTRLTALFGGCAAVWVSNCQFSR